MLFTIKVNLSINFIFFLFGRIELKQYYIDQIAFSDFIEDLHMGLISYSFRNENEKIVCVNKVSNRLLSFQIYQRKHLYVLIKVALDGIRS